MDSMDGFRLSQLTSASPCNFRAPRMRESPVKTSPQVFSYYGSKSTMVLCTDPQNNAFQNEIGGLRKDNVFKLWFSEVHMTYDGESFINPELRLSLIPNWDRASPVAQLDAMAVASPEQKKKRKRSDASMNLLFY